MTAEERQAISVYPIATSIVTGGGTTTSTVSCALASTLCVRFLVRADGGNTGNIWIGASDVTSSTGICLSATQHIRIEAPNINVAYVYATSSTQNYAWLAEVM